MNKDEVQQDVKAYKSLDVLAGTEGGKLVIRNLKRDIVDDIDSLVSHWNGTETELRSWTIKLKADLQLLRTLMRARSNKKLALDAFESMEKELEESIDTPHR